MVTTMDALPTPSTSFSSGGAGSGACEVCGWLAAFGGMVAFGSFGVPIKSKVATSVDIDPLVMQSYKTGVCFLTSWLILLSGEESFAFTPWGIVSGLFWVPGGVATIYAIKNAGLAIGMGVASSFIVLVSFLWGIFIFGERVHSRPQACFAVGCMLCGLMGMAYYSAPTVAHAHGASNTNEDGFGDYDPSVRPEDPDFLAPDEDEEFVPLASLGPDYVPLEDGNEIINSAELEMDGIDDHDDLPRGAANVDAGVQTLPCCGRLQVRKRTLGILSAVFTGVYGGSIMVPMKFAPKMDRGLGFLISFSIGAALVNLTLWVVRYLYLCQRHLSFFQGYQELPSFHFGKMWLYGASCGLLWSIGNFCSLLAVEYLGLGVGYSLTQSSMLVSGLWGIFYFHEIEGTTPISKWYVSAMVTVLGIFLLSYEHHVI
jgi:glucose uptake protein GlcU